MTPATEQIPDHLKPFIAEQDPNLYTAIDHAGWRYILRVSKDFFRDYAHEKYLTGLEQTGISIDRIPLISEMDEKLRRFGWRAVAVTGFIPPAAFMEFQSLGILPIACDMRKLEHLAYTPAPDIVHEAAGHAPILADPEYAEYLRAYGQVARRAIYSKKDMDLYEAILNLSETKEDPEATQAQIDQAQEQLQRAVANLDYVSESNYLTRMFWWTVEYGLVGPIRNPKIYGAGLLSSVGESYACLQPAIKRIPFTLDCLNMSYDITRPQPQLYVAESFQSLTEALREYEGTMAFRRGGMEGLAKAKMGESVCTVELDSGLQLSGVVTEFYTDGRTRPCFIRLTGPSQLAHADQELPGHSPQYHKQGYSSPIGPLKEKGKPLSHFNARELSVLGLFHGKPATLEFQSGITVSGTFKAHLERDEKLLVLTFDKCTVQWGAQVLFNPEWGTFDLACGDKIQSVFGGAADRGKYLEATPQKSKAPRPQKSNQTTDTQTLAPLYQKVRNLRTEALSTPNPDLNRLTQELAYVLDSLDEQFPQDWLLRLEMLELDEKLGIRAEWRIRIERELREISKTSPVVNELIARGLKALQT